eukprot:s3_g44.t1
MCRAGGLVDPESQIPMKKGMTVLTTFAHLFERFHGLTCDNRHHHQPIEGTCRTAQGERMLRSQYTEIYPRKFARAVAQVLIKNHACMPYGWNPELAAYVENMSSEPAPALVATKFRAKPQFVRSEVVIPVARANPEEKRSKRDLNQGSAPTLEMCQQAIQAVNEILPRVGRKEIANSKTLDLVQQVFPEKRIHRVVACRGTDRTMEPPKDMHSQEAPYRRILMLGRDGTIKYEKDWERWGELSKRQLKRPSHACRINVTVFAHDIPRNSQSDSVSQERTDSIVHPPENEDAPIDQQTPSRSVPDIEPAEQFEKPMQEMSDESNPKQPEETAGQPCMSRSESSFDRPPSSGEGSFNPLPPDPQSASLDPMIAQQSPRFRSLPRWEQQMIIKLHKNLGHPSNDRLSKALQVQGCRPEIIQAALEIKCAACARHAPPKNARPASLKPLLDFNHRVYLDGVNWTNGQGKTYHFFHVLDAGTNYHVAMASPAKTTEDLIQVLNQHWLSWAGPPSELIVDSGTEMNSQSFAEFTQRFNIRSTTTAPEAHWQSGKIERHGAFLQSMLSKVDLEHPIQSYQDLQMALNQCVHAKNSLSIRHGYAPEIIVFGKHTRLPGSVLSDESLPSHEQALQEEHAPGNADFRKMLAIREAARRAFHTSDNSDVLRRALLRRACPSRGVFTKGQWVMIWRHGPSNQPRWYGPHRVIIQDENHTVWCTSNGKLFRSAPKNTRMAFPEEGSPEGPDLPNDITPMTQQIARLNQNNPPNNNPSNSPTDNPLDTIPEPENTPNQQNNQPLEADNSDSQDESIPQPDTEPENGNPDDFQYDPTDMPAEEPPATDAPSDQDLLMLTCEEPDNAFTCEDAGVLAWSCEFDMSLNVPLETHVPSEEESWIMLATSSKKQRSEVKLSNLSAAELAEFQKAKQAEVENWIKTGTISAILRHQIPEEQILKCRWILTWKPLDNVGNNVEHNSYSHDQSKGQKGEKTNQNYKTHKAKARLVVLGYLDPQIENINGDSPTLNKTSRMMILQTISSHTWKVRSFDIKAAFLQGQPQAGRVIAVDPVPELRQAMALKPQQICKLNKGAYGLIDAPYLWYCALVTELERLGFEACPFDPCCFILRTPATATQPARLEGILGVHVDDGLGGGSPIFEEAVRKLEQTFPFGSHKISAFTFTGIEINQHSDFSITLNQSEYVRKISAIPIEPNRKSQPELPVTEKERLALRGIVGSLQYAAINTRPDLSSKLSFLQSAINTAKIETLMEGVLHEAKKHHDVTITIKPIPYQDFRFLAFSDASFSSTTKPDSHAGSIIVGTHQDINRNCQSPISPITWGDQYSFCRDDGTIVHPRSAIMAEALLELDP